MALETIAFIPVRGASKSIPDKNVRLIAGRPLLHWVLEATDRCEEIDRIVVSTDSPRIAALARSFGSGRLEIHERSPQTATDEASTESALLEYATACPGFDLVALVQATSPLTTSEDLSRALRTLREGAFDSVLSVVRQKRFIWRVEDGSAEPVNYDITARPRRQEFDGFLVENGALYATSRSALIRSGCRLSGRVGVVEMEESSYHELDEPGDWPVVESLLMRRLTVARTNLSADLSGIRALFSDCDGVLTDGGMYYSEAGDELKRFTTRDGMGFELLREAGILTGIITSESVDLVRRRAQKMRLDVVRLGERDKLRAVTELCAEYGLSLDEIAYVGDDLLDVPAIRAVGFGCCPSDAVATVRKAADHVTTAPGGGGVVREIADLILMARGVS